MIITELDDTDEPDLYPPMPEIAFDAVIEGSQHDAKYLEAARWVLVPLLDIEGNQMLTRDGEWVVLSVSEAAFHFDLDPRGVRRVVVDIRRAYANYRMAHGFVESYGPASPAQWQATSALQSEAIKATANAKPKTKRSYFRKKKG